MVELLNLVKCSKAISDCSLDSTFVLTLQKIEKKIPYANSEPAGRSSIGYTRDFCFYYGPDIIHHIPIQNQWRRPQNYPECQPSGAAILNARNQY